MKAIGWATGLWLLGAILAPHPANALSDWGLEPLSAEEKAQAATGIEWGERFPDMVLFDQDGKRLTLSDFQGRWLFLHFWGSFCKPCIKEMPHLNSFRQTMKDAGMAFVLVSVPRHPFEHETAWLEKNGYDLPNYRLDWRPWEDKKKKEKKARPVGLANGKTRIFRPPGLPTSFILDPEGYVTGVYERTDWSAAEEKGFRQAMQEQPKPEPTEKGAEAAATVIGKGKEKQLRITLRGNNGWRLNGPYGLTATPEEQPGIAWNPPGPRTVTTPKAYFPDAVTLTLPFQTTGGADEAGATVEYAYCPDDSRCLMDELTVRAPLPP